ncbi:MAG: ABC transporter permease [Candidatus Muiribacteriota bacterium]
MNNIFFIIKKEMKHFFQSPLAYIFLTVFLLISSFFFVSSLERYINASTNATSPYAEEVELTFSMAAGNFLGNLSVVLLFIIPIICMRSIAEERKTGTFELLMTSPIKNWELILGKYFSVLIVFLIMILFLMIYPLAVYFIMPFFIKPLFSIFLGFFLLGAACSAVSVFFSALSKSPVYAAIWTFGALLIMWVASWSGEVAGGYTGAFLTQLSLLTHIRSFMTGIISLNNLIYFISVIFYTLFLSNLYIDSIRWRE